MIGLIIAFLSLSVYPAFATIGGPVIDDPPASVPAPEPLSDTLRPAFVDVSPVIDGELNDPVWLEARRFTGFQTFIPDFSIVPKEQTEVALSYDRENIYFAFRCYDRPEMIKYSMSARDKMMSDDFICINLDAFNDQQGMNAFYVNPLGIQGDSRFAAGNEDFNPDYVWYSAGKIDSAGYTIEVQLPLKTLRYRDSDPTVMGVILERYISRRSEHSSVPPLSPEKGFAFLTQMHPVVYTGIEHYTLLEILPAVTATRQDVQQNGALSKDLQEAQFSLTGKYGLTSDLVLDGTYNPDFSQIESDAGQADVNLRFSLFYPEKRPFFLEGQDNYTVAATANEFDPIMYYSRTVADPLLGVKLAGKIGAQNTVAATYATDRVLGDDQPVYGEHAYVPVVRYKRTLDEDSYVGMLAAAREYGGRYNRIAGLDEQYRVSESALLSGNGFYTWTRDHPAGETFEGHTLGFRLASGTRDLEYSLNFREVSEDFRADMGYVTRTGVLNFIGVLRPKFYPESDFLQRIDLSLATGQTKDIPSGLWETGNDLGLTVLFGGSWSFGTTVTYATEIFGTERFQTSGISVRLRTQMTREISWNVNYARRRSIYYPAPEQGKSNIAGASLTIQPWEQVNLQATFNYSDFTSDATGLKVYDFPITRVRLIYQFNQYLFVRAIGEYNGYRENLATDFLVSFTYIPGTVVYLGYGSVYEKLLWDGTGYVDGTELLETERGIFLKMSYLWRM